MRKVCLLFIGFCCILLTACDPYVNQTPDNYPGSKWICEDPLIIYEVDYYGESLAYTEIDGEIIYFNLGFCSSTVGASFIEPIGYDEFGNEAVNECFSGTVDYGKQKFVITINKEGDELFNGKYDKLTFNRVN